MLVANTVANPVPDTIDMKAADIRRACVEDQTANRRLLQQKRQYGFQNLTNRSGSRWPIEGPPFGDAIDFASGTTRDKQFKRH